MPNPRFRLAAPALALALTACGAPPASTALREAVPQAPGFSSAEGGIAYGGARPEHALDGNFSSAWNAAPGAGGLEAHWIGTLSAPATLTGLSLKSAPLPAGAALYVEVQTSEGGPWQSVGSPWKPPSTWKPTVLSLPETPGVRRVRLRLVAPGLPHLKLQLFEITPLGRTGSAPASPPPSPVASPLPSPSVAPTSPPAPAPGPWLQRLSAPGAGFASSGGAAGALDLLGQTLWYPSVTVTAATPARLTLPLAPAAGSDTLYLRWDSGGYPYLNTLAAPKRLAIEASADSPDGRGGSFVRVASFTDNAVRSRVMAFSAPGARWIRLVCDERVSTGPGLNHVAVFQAGGQSGPAPVAAIFGDSITAQSFSPQRATEAFGPAVEQEAPGLGGALALGAGTGGDTAIMGEGRLAVGLETLPPGALVGLAYGANDATTSVGPAAYEAALSRMIQKIKASGRTPMLARPCYTLNGQLGSYVQVVDALTAREGLPPGPDLYTPFRAHPEWQRTDHVHPNAQGEIELQRLWGAAVGKALKARRL